MCRKRPELWILYHNNAPAHKAFSAKAQNLVTEMENLPCSPDLSPNVLWLFPKIKSASKGRIFQDTADNQKM
jgi:hypothetical protein